jgi:hypothetical protein
MSAFRRSQILTVASEMDMAESEPHRAALASLPRRFLMVGPTHAADVRLVRGTPGTWPVLVEAALEKGARAVMVAARAPASDPTVTPLLARAERTDAVIAMAARWAGSRSWRSVRTAIEKDARSATIVDSSITWVGDADDAAGCALLDHLALVGDILPQSQDLKVRSASADHYVVAGVSRDASVVISGTRSDVDAPRLRLDIPGPRARWRVWFDGTAPARPAVIERHTKEGLTGRPVRFESGLRAVWMDLHDHLTRGSALPRYLSVDRRHLAIAAELRSFIDPR